MANESGDDEEWRFAVDDFPDTGPDADDSPTDESAPSLDDGSEWDRPDDGRDDGVEAAEREGESGDDGNVAGEFAPEIPVVPEMPELENAIFVTLGAILTILAIALLVGGPSFGAVDAFVVAAIVAAIGAVAYAAFVRMTPDT